MKIVTVAEAKRHLSKLLCAIEKDGEPILICRNRKPVAELVAYKKKDRLNPHPLLRKVTISYDPVENLSLSEWPAANR